MKKSERLNQELIFLSAKHVFQLHDLMTEFNISKRTALRDIAELETLGLPFYVENGRHGGYHLISQKLLTPIYFNEEEIRAIFFALEALNSLSSTPFKKSYPQIRQKLLATMPVAQQADITKVLDVIHYYNVAPINAPANLASITQAILENKIVTVTYTQYTPETTQLQIYELFYRNGIWFCSAYDLQKKHWGTYRCDYMTELAIDHAHTATYSQAELSQLQQDYEQQYHDIPFKCRLTAFGKELFLKNNYPNMTLETIDQVPYITGSYNQEELAYMTHYLITFGEHVTIEYPEQLKNSYLQQLQTIIARYQ